MTITLPCCGCLATVKQRQEPTVCTWHTRFVGFEHLLHQNFYVPQHSDVSFDLCNEQISVTNNDLSFVWEVLRTVPIGVIQSHLTPNGGSMHPLSFTQVKVLLSGPL